jgi:cell division protein FtsW (lipid II flippase)
MNPRITFALRIALAVLIGMLVVILLSVNKISSSIVLIITFVVVLLPLKSQWAKWCRVAFVLVVFALVAWNISTTEYPVGYYNTGFKPRNSPLKSDAYLMSTPPSTLPCHV